MRVLVAGDLHGTPAGATALVNLAHELDVAEAWQVGDLGYWPKEAGWSRFAELLDQSPVDIYFADGNHEDHYALQSGTPDLPPRRLSERIIHQPRGTVREIYDHRVMFFGGAQSVDRTYRKAHVSWFPTELPNYADWDRAAQAGEVDIVVAHEVPSVVGFGYPKAEHSYWPTEDLKRAEGHRNALREHLLPSAKPDVWFHGHHHSTRYSNVGGTRFYGLNCDGNPGTFVLYNLEKRAGRFVYMDRHGGVAGVKPKHHVISNAL